MENIWNKNKKGIVYAHFNNGIKPIALIIIVENRDGQYYVPVAVHCNENNWFNAHANHEGMEVSPGVARFRNFSYYNYFH